MPPTGPGGRDGDFINIPDIQSILEAARADNKHYNLAVMSFETRAQLHGQYMDLTQSEANDYDQIKPKYRVISNPLFKGILLLEIDYQ